MELNKPVKFGDQFYTDSGYMELETVNILPPSLLP